MVYRARDEQLKRDIAIKALPVGMPRDDSARKRFRKEALSLAKLNHLNIATIHAFSSQDDIDFLATEFIPGITLYTKLAGAHLSTETMSEPLATEPVFELKTLSS